MTACELCGGVCCQYFTLPKSLFIPERIKWLASHGTEEETRILFDIPCKAFKDGKCSMYDNNRPNDCKAFPVGGARCIEAIERIAPKKLEEIKKLFNN
jgi:hypothetical protein